MDPLTIGALVLAAAGIFTLGHWNGAARAVAQLKADVAKLPTMTDVTEHVKNRLQAVQDAVQQGPAAAGSVADVVHRAEVALSHPIEAVEHTLAQHHAGVVMDALDKLWDDSKALAKVAEGQAEIEFNNALRAKVQAKFASMPK